MAGGGRRRLFDGIFSNLWSPEMYALFQSSEIGNSTDSEASNSTPMASGSREEALLLFGSYFYDNMSPQMSDLFYNVDDYQDEDEGPACSLSKKGEGPAGSPSEKGKGLTGSLSEKGERPPVGSPSEKGKGPTCSLSEKGERPTGSPSEKSKGPEASLSEKGKGPDSEKGERPVGSPAEKGTGPEASHSEKGTGPEASHSEKGTGPKASRSKKGKGPKASLSEKSKGPKASLSEKGERPVGSHSEKGKGPDSEKGERPVGSPAEKGKGPTGSPAEKGTGPEASHSEKGTGPKASRSKKSKGPKASRSEKGKEPEASWYQNGMGGETSSSDLWEQKKAKRWADIPKEIKRFILNIKKMEAMRVFYVHKSGVCVRTHFARLSAAEEERGATSSEPAPAPAPEGVHLSTKDDDIPLLSPQSETPPADTVPWEEMEFQGDFTYTIDGKIKERLYFGRTSCSKTLSKHQTKKITIFTFDVEEIEKANELRDALLVFEEPSIVNCLYLNEKSVVVEGKEEIHVIIERMDGDLRMFIDKFFTRPHYNTVRDWFFSENAFQTTFRGIVIGLSKVFEEGNYCVAELLDVATVSVHPDHGNSKLVKLVKKEVSQKDRFKEMKDLGKTMATFITNDDVDFESESSKERLKNLNVPDYIIDFIGKCSFTTTRNIGQLRWILDFSGLWDSKTSKKWVDMAAGVTWKWILHRNFAASLDKILLLKLKVDDWSRLMPVDNSRLGKMHTAFKRRGNGHVFNDLIRFVRNVFKHYNDPIKNYKLEDHEILDLMEYLFEYKLIVILRETLHDALFLGTPPLEVEWNEMLTRMI